MNLGGCPLCGCTRSVPTVVTPQARLVRCDHCRLVYQDPAPPLDAVHGHYEDLYVEGSARIDARRQALFDGFLDAVPPFGLGRLLDVGCGSGVFLAAARARGWTVHGVEVTAQGAAAAQRRGLTVHQDIAELPDEFFDAVTLWNVVDFFVRPVEQMREVHRVLAPGGLVFVRTPNAGYQLAAWRLSRLAPWPPGLARLLNDAYFFQPILWAPTTLRLLLLCAGLTDIRMWNSPVSAGDPYHAASPARERVVGTVKRALYGVARGVATTTRGRFLVGSSLSAIARKPD